MQAGSVRLDSMISTAANDAMHPSLIRVMWGAVEQCVKRDNSCDLFDLSDQRLIQQVLAHWPNHLALNDGEQSAVQDYLTQRINLIRDLIEF